MANLRPYQIEDVQAVVKAFDSHRCVLGRAATGLGKAVELAFLAKLFSEFGRVMVLVDTQKLVNQLADTIEWVADMQPGIEMGELRANNGGKLVAPDRIVISTPQTQYSGKEGSERYRQFDPAEFSAVLLDECETFLAEGANSVVNWYMQNPTLKVYGCTATPMRTDGKAMGDLFQCVAFDRDIIWGIDNGWLVPAKQAFVRVSLDFSTLSVRKKDGEEEADYSDEEIAERINNEQTAIELAKGIIHVAGVRRSIVVCPNVNTAKTITHYLDAERNGCARVVYGEMTPIEKEDVMNAHQRGEFQFLCSVMMLTKGYDDPQVSAIFNCRKTRSKRLYQQILGRGTRPLKGLLEGVEEVDARRGLIAGSEKPDMLMVNMVGVDDSVRDIMLVDILGEKKSEAIRERAKKKMLEKDPDEESEPSRELEEAEDEDRKEREAAEARQRRRVQVKANVDVEYHDDLRVSSGEWTPESGQIDPWTLRTLTRAKVPESIINRLSAKRARELVKEIKRHWKNKLCSYKQAEVLLRAGYTKQELRNMPYDDASAAIERAKANGWKRGEAA
jgi:superfamily II DNA or RNA helicase